MDREHRNGLSTEELDAQRASPLPDREALSVISPVPGGHGLATVGPGGPDDPNVYTGPAPGGPDDPNVLTGGPVGTPDEPVILTGTQPA